MSEKQEYTFLIVDDQDLIIQLIKGILLCLLIFVKPTASTTAKRAIDKHFAKRNRDFKKNPKRAGNKIWGKELVKPVFINKMSSGLFSG